MDTGRLDELLSAEQRRLNEVLTPAAVVDVDRMAANLDRMAQYTSSAGIALRPHTKTHKTPELAAEQLKRGAVGVTVATVHEAEVMSRVAEDILIAYPPVGAQKLERMMHLADRVRLTAALDSSEALNALAAAARQHRRRVGVLVEIDAGMNRVGLADPKEVVSLARTIGDHNWLEFRGLMFYPGHIREPVFEQPAAIARVNALLAEHIGAVRNAGLEPRIISGGSTPAAFLAHNFEYVNEVRPGTYIFNDRTTASIGACEWSDCAYSVAATVVSTSVPGQAVVDAGSKALSREDIRGANAPGFGALFDRPEVYVRALSEEHGILDLSRTEWRPRVGDRVRIVPDHVCVSVNLHNRLWAVRGDEILGWWSIAARNWS